MSRTVVWLIAGLAVLMLATSVVVVAGALTTPAGAADLGASPPAPGSTPGTFFGPVPGPSSGAPPVAVGSGCPSAEEVLRVFARAAPKYGTGARATSDVTCAGGFAVMSLRSPSTPDGLRTIYEIGPPLRHLGSGTGPICSDDASDGSVTVPASVAATLGCTSSGGQGPERSGQSTGATGGDAASGADPYGCLAERNAQERSFDTNDPTPNSELTCSYNYGPALPSTREQCWLAHHDLQDGSGFIDDRARRDYEKGCSRFGY